MAGSPPRRNRAVSRARTLVQAAGPSAMNALSADWPKTGAPASSTPASSSAARSMIRSPMVEQQRGASPPCEKTPKGRFWRGKSQSAAFALSIQVRIALSPFHRAIMRPSGVLRSAFGCGPLVQHGPFYLIQLLVHLRRAGVDGQFEPVAIRVEKVDGLKKRMVGDADNLNPVRFQSRLGRFQVVQTLQLEGNVLDPGRRVFVPYHCRLGRQFKECQNIAVPGVQEYVHVRVGCFGRGYLVLSNCQDEVHAEILAVPIDRLFRV